MSGAAFGGALAWTFKLHDSRRVRALTARARPRAHPVDSNGLKESALARQAREAATRMETRRATQLYKELADLEPRHVEHLSAYLNTALLGPDETALQDAALRLLWLRSKSHSDQLRKAFLQLTQPKVLKVLPIDEHLRLARRLVKLHEDAAALKVLAEDAQPGRWLRRHPARAVRTPARRLPARHLHRLRAAAPDHAGRNDPVAPDPVLRGDE